MDETTMTQEQPKQRTADEIAQELGALLEPTPGEARDKVVKALRDSIDWSDRLVAAVKAAKDWCESPDEQ